MLKRITNKSTTTELLLLQINKTVYFTGFKVLSYFMDLIPNVAATESLYNNIQYTTI